VEAVVVVPASAADEAAARQLAGQLQLPFSLMEEASGLLLVSGNGAVELVDIADRGVRPLRVEFAAGRARHRRLYGGGELLRKALGSAGSNALVVDAGAGLGADSFVMASLGYRVLAVERSAVIHALLADGLARAAGELELQSIVAQISLQRGDATEFLTRMSEEERPDIIHMDPMYPPRRKSALGRRELRLLHLVVGEDGDAGGLLEIARHRAKRRVVVKRPLRADSLGSAPGFSVRGKAVRYDVYPV